MTVSTMNLPFTDLTHIKRRFPFPLRVGTTCFIPDKDHWVRRSIGHDSFSVILKGRGEARVDGKVYEIKAPCIFMKWADTYLEYGHLRPEDAWDEYYFTFVPDSTAYLERTGLIDRNRPIQPLVGIDVVKDMIQHIAVLTRDHPLELVADHVDRICENIILETQMPRADGKDNTGDPITVLTSMMRRLPKEQFNLRVFAQEHGMSEATLRRRWSAAIGLSPRRYLEQVRPEESCRLLAETRDPVKAISAAVGFDDAFYFSRRFQQKFGISPTEYRKVHAISG